MAATERAACAHLHELAARHLGRGRPVQFLVRFGDLPAEVARAAEATRAALVVAASRPAHGLLARSRDARLVAEVERPVALVSPRAQGRARPRAVQPLTA
jgi:nucleotide-binding universal stress UspA family protein